MSDRLFDAARQANGEASQKLKEMILNGCGKLIRDALLASEGGQDGAEVEEVQQARKERSAGARV